MRKLGIAVAIIIVLLVVVIVAVPMLLDINRYHGLVQAQLEKALQRPVSFGQMHLSLTPPSVRMDNVVIGESPAFGRGAFASTDAIDASVKLLPLLHKDVQLQSLELRNPKVQLIKNARGVWNFQTLGQAPPSPATPGSKPSQPPAKQAPAPPAQQPGGSEGGGFVLSNLKITNGQITIIDQQKNSKAVYNNIDLGLSGYAPGKRFDISAAVHLPGAGKEEFKLDGALGPVDQSEMLNTPFDGKLSLKEVSLGGVQKLLDSPSLQGMQGTASGDVKIKNQNGTLTSSGSVELKDAVVRSVKIDYPIALDYSFTDQLASDKIHIDSAKLKLGPTPLSIAGDIDAGATPANMNVHLTASNASIEEVARLASAFGVAFNPSMKVSGGLSADLHAQGPTTALAMNGNVTGKDLRISGGELKQPVDVKAIELTLTPRDIRSTPFAATSGGTTVNVQFALMNYAGASPMVDATVKTGNANVAELLAIADAYGVDAVKGMSGTGTMSLDLHATGPMKNTNAMNFSGNGKLSNASLKTPQVTQPINIRNADLQFSQNAASLNNLVASFAGTNANGNLTMRNFNAPQIQFTLNADKVNVAQLQAAMATAPAQPGKRASLELLPRAYAQMRPAAPAPGFMDKATGGGSITVGSLEYDQLLMQNLRSNVTLDHGIVKLAPITAGLYGGEQVGSIIVDLRPTPMVVTMQTKLQQVDANKLLSSVSSIKQTLYGLLAANANTNFRAASSQDIARTLNGTLSLNLTKGKLVGVDLLNQLANIGKFTGLASSSGGGQPFTDIVQLTGNFNVVNGLAQTNDLKALIPGGSVAADGALNLASEALNMHLTAVLGKELSQKVGGTGIGGFMQTALANNNGELVIPVLVSGTFARPIFAPDVQKLAQMKLQNMLPTAGNPGAFTSGILGAITGARGKGQAGQGQGGLGGILGAIGGQQQQQQQGKQPVASPQQPPQQQQQQQPQNPFGDLLNQVMGGKKKQPDQQQQPQKPPQ
ncbi:MAG: AsmA family protein [Terriglobales bacterium]